MATVNIGNLTFTHRGDYDGSTAYAKNDVVYYSTNGNAYIAKQATTGNVPTNATYWSQFAQGSGGIWNSGLSLGSASQKLRVNSGGNALEFFTEPAVTSDWVKLVETTAGGSESSISVDGYFSTTYKIYKAFLSNVCFNANPANYFKFRVNVGGSAHSANYYASEDGVYSTSSANTQWQGRRWNGSDLQMGGWNAPTVDTTGTNAHTNYEYTFFEPTSSFYKNIQCVFGGWERAQNYTYCGTVSGVIHQTSALTGFTVENNSSSTFRAGTKVSLYGLK